MVRTINNDEAEDRKETTKKKASAAKNMKKLQPTMGIWPCKMNGCTKQFAREADLKRHQRTTKLHSMPSFACPQCDATFTRTDALRRHQKSRHNGVAEPMELGKETDEPGQSSSRSSSATPSSKGKERENSTVPMIPMTEAIGAASTSSLATPVTSYYRQHTANNSNYVPPRPAHYAQVNLPTSGPRPNSNGWTHPPSWTDGPSHPSLTTMPYMYIASPYYRTNSVMVPPPMLTPVSQTPGPSAFSKSPHSRKGDDCKASPDSPESSSSSLMADIETNDVYPSTSSHHSNIHPSASQSSSTQNFDQFLSKAGMEAVSCEEQNHQGSGMVGYATNTTRIRTSHDFAKTKEPPESISENLDEHFPDLEAEGDQEEHFHNRIKEHGYEPRIDRPVPMEHMLTDDGEPMLNPAELLTQESLASPEPS